MTKDKLKKVVIALSVIVLGLGTYAVMGYVQASFGMKEAIARNAGHEVAQLVIEDIKNEPSLDGEIMGAFISSGSNLTDLTVENDLVVANQFREGGASGLKCQVKTGSFTSASTTLFAIAVPDSVTSTVEYGKVQITGYSTTSLYISVVTSTKGYLNTGGYATATSTGGTAPILDAIVMGTTTPVVYSGVEAEEDNGYGFVDSNPNIGSQGRFIIKGSNYLIGIAKGYKELGDGYLGSTEGITNTNSAWTGTYWFKFCY